MKKAGYFFRTILVFIIAFLIQFGATVLVCFLQGMAGGSAGITDALSMALSASYDQSLLLYILIAYAAISVLIFGLWYNGRFIIPFQGMKRNYQSGFTLLTILTLVIVAFGFQFFGGAIVQLFARFAPALTSAYTEGMSNLGIGTGFAPLMILYVVIIGPIAEELIFRGLIYRFARLAFPFWIANIWQAALFGIFHMNVVQAVYAFLFGLILGYIAHRGHGIRYSIFAHIACNALGTFAAFFFDALTESFTGLSILIGAILVLFAIFVFSVEFHPLHKTRPVGQRQ